MADEDGIAEKWAVLADYSEAFSVSSLGKVRDNRSGKERRLHRAGAGYLVAILPRLSPGTCGNRYVHRLVAESFIGPPPSSEAEVNHKNGTKTDNRLENLEWTDRAGNAAHASATGLAAFGTRNGMAKLTPELLAQAREMKRTGKTWRELGEFFGMSRDGIRLACLGRTWTAQPGAVQAQAGTGPKMSQEAIGILLSHLDAGRSMIYSAAMAGIARSTAYAWLRKAGRR